MNEDLQKGIESGKELLGKNYENNQACIQVWLKITAKGRPSGLVIRMALVYKKYFLHITIAWFDPDIFNLANMKLE